MNKLLLILTLSIIGLTACTPPSNLAKYQAVTLNNEPISLQTPKGKVLVLHFWASWCRDCLIEIPDLETAWAQLEETEKAKFEVIFLSDEETERITTFLEKKKLPAEFKQYRLTKSFKNIGVWSIPQTYVFKDDKIIRQWDRGVPWTAEIFRELSRQ